MSKEIKLTIILGIYGSFLTIIGIVMANPQVLESYDFMWEIYSIGVGTIIMIFFLASLVVIPSIKEKQKSPWPATKSKKNELIKLSFDIHESSNWENDNRLFLCVHNDSFFRDIKNISIVLTPVIKNIKPKPECVLTRSVILQRNVGVPKRKGCVDFPLFEVVKRDNKFIIHAIHSDEPDKVFEHEFDYGEYDTHIVFKRNDINRDSVPVQIRIKYDGWDKISVNLVSFSPKAIFPISV